MATINATIKTRRKTAAAWVADATVLAEGEFGYATDTGDVKIGDGATIWASLETIGTGSDPWAPLLENPSLRGESRTEILTNAERVTAGLGEWLDGTAGRIQSSETGTPTYLFSCELDGTANVIVRTTVTGEGAATSIVGDVTRSTAMTSVPVGATALGGKVYCDYDTDTLVMVTHTNRDATHPSASGNIWSAAGIAKSTDWGATWDYLGDVVTVEIPIGDANVGSNTIGSFSPYVIAEMGGTDYFVIFHQDQLADGTVVRQCASRCTLASFLSDVAADTAPTFTKWDGFGWNELGLSGTPGPLWGITTAESGQITHADVLAAPDAGGYFMITAEGTTIDTHRVSFAPSPEGPWRTPTNPWTDDPAGVVQIYSTWFGSDPTRPWEIAADGYAYGYEVVQATLSDWTSYTVELATLVPAYGGPRTFRHDGVGLVLDLGAAPSTYSAWDVPPFSAPEAVVTGGVYLIYYDVAGGLPGLWLAGPTDWIWWPDQPDVGDVILPRTFPTDTATDPAYVVFRKVSAGGAYYPDSGVDFAATRVLYTPGNGTHWADPDPETLPEALDRLAAAVYAATTNTPIP